MRKILFAFLFSTLILCTALFAKRASAVYYCNGNTAQCCNSYLSTVCSGNGCDPDNPQPGPGCSCSNQCTAGTYTATCNWGTGANAGYCLSTTCLNPVNGSGASCYVTGGPTPTPGSCTDGACYTASGNCGTIGKVAGTGTCSSGQLCCKDQGGNIGIDMGAYAYCQDPGGPVYPLPGLSLKYDSFVDYDCPGPNTTMDPNACGNYQWRWGQSSQPSTHTTDAAGRAFIGSKMVSPAIHRRVVSINNYAPGTKNLVNGVWVYTPEPNPLKNYTTQSIAATGQLYKNLKRGPNDITQINCDGSIGSWVGKNDTNMINGQPSLCGPYYEPDQGYTNGYIFGVPYTGQYNAIWHFTNCQPPCALQCGQDDGNGGFCPNTLGVTPGIPTNLSPAAGSSIAQTSATPTVNITWTGGTSSDEYDIEVFPLGGSCATPGAACSYTSDGNGTTTAAYSFTPTTYSYSYRVRGVNTACTNAVYGPWSPLTTFSLTSLISGTVYIDNSGVSAPSGGICSAAGSLPAYTSPAAGTLVTATNPLLNTQASSWVPVAGDWTGSGVTTTGLYDQSTGTFHLKTSNASGVDDISFLYGTGGQGLIPVAGDWDGNGTTTIGVYNPATAVFSLRNSNTTGTADLTFTYGSANNGWLPIAGDWDGNGTWTIGLYDPAVSIFYLRNTNSTGVSDVAFLYGNGGAGWIPVTGDWDGNGTVTVALYSQANNTFYLKNTNGGSVFSDVNALFGSANNAFIPLSGKWAGGTGIGAYDPTITTYYLRNTADSGNADTTFQYTGSNTGGYAPGFVTASGTYSITGLPFQPAAGAGQTGATLTLTDSTYTCICPTGCSYGAAQNTPKTNLNFYIGRAGSAWYQTIGGDVAASTATGVVVNDQINAFCTTPSCEPYLILPPSGATGQSYGSLTIKTNASADLTDQSGNQESNVGPAGFSYLVKTNTPQSTAENYNYFYRLYSMGTAPSEDFAVPTSATLPGSAPANGKLAYYRGGDMIIDSNWDVTAGNSYVIFVNGNLTVSNSATITVAQGAFLSFIVSGNITFDSTIGTATFASTGPGQIQGVYIANGVLKVESAGTSGTDLKFIGEGTFVGYSGIRLPRDFSNGGNGTQNNNYPASLFVHRPDFVINTPARMKKAVMNWREVEP